MLDNEHILKDAGAVTSSGFGEVDASAQVINLGSGLVRGNVVIDVSALVMQGNDQLVQLYLMGGDDASFTKTVALAQLELGPKEVIESNWDSKLSRFIMPFQNEQGGVIYHYIRIRHVLTGTSPSINYKAHLAKDLPVIGRTLGTTTTTV
jgi:hypothetical protein